MARLTTGVSVLWLIISLSATSAWSFPVVYMKTSSKMGGLFRAISNYDYGAVKYLLKQHGAKKRINETHNADGDIFTPLQWAIHTMIHGSYRDEFKSLKLPSPKERAQAFEVIDLILQKGGDPDIYDSRGDTPLHLAARKLNLPLLELLLENRAEINALNNNGETVLHVIARDARAYRGRDKVADFLLNQGANPHIINADNQLAVDLAKSSGDEVMEKVLSNSWWLIFNPQPSLKVDTTPSEQA